MIIFLLSSLIIHYHLTKISIYYNRVVDFVSPENTNIIVEHPILDPSESLIKVVYLLTYFDPLLPFNIIDQLIQLLSVSTLNIITYHELIELVLDVAL